MPFSAVPTLQPLLLICIDILNEAKLAFRELCGTITACRLQLERLLASLPILEVLPRDNPHAAQLQATIASYNSTLFSLAVALLSAQQTGIYAMQCLFGSPQLLDHSRTLDAIIQDVQFVLSLNVLCLLCSGITGLSTQLSVPASAVQVDASRMAQALSRVSIASASSKEKVLAEVQPEVETEVTLLSSEGSSRLLKENAMALPQRIFSQTTYRVFLEANSLTELAAFARGSDQHGAVGVVLLARGNNPFIWRLLFLRSEERTLYHLRSAFRRSDLEWQLAFFAAENGTAPVWLS